MTDEPKPMTPERLEQIDSDRQRRPMPLVEENELIAEIERCWHKMKNLDQAAMDNAEMLDKENARLKETIRVDREMLKGCYDKDLPLDLIDEIRDRLEEK